MAEDDSNSWSSATPNEEGDMSLPGPSELIDVMWLSGSAIAVAPRIDPPPVVERGSPAHTNTSYSSRSPSRSISPSPPRLSPRSPVRSTSSLPMSSPQRSTLTTRLTSTLPSRSTPRLPSRSTPRLPSRSIPRLPSRSAPRLPSGSYYNTPTSSRQEVLYNNDVSRSEDDSRDTVVFSASHDEESSSTETESESESESDSEELSSEETPARQVTQSVSNLDRDSVIQFHRVNQREQLSQQPNVVSAPENPTPGMENPIIRLENPDYEPEPCKSTSSDSTRAAGKRSYGDMISEEEDDGQTCPICLDNWSNAGEHRLSALKCGHLFGKSCIMRWLTREKKKYCPQCNKRAHSNDVRDLYATKLTALDISERTKLEKEIQKLKSEYKKLELELIKANLNVEMYKEQLEVMKTKVCNLYSGLEDKKEKNDKFKTVKFFLEKTFEVNEGCCRVCAHDPLHNVLIVSHQSRNQLFPGFGIKKIQKVGSDYFGNNFIYLHSKAIRDLCFHPETPHLILTVSFDRCAKLADLKNHSIVSSFRADYPLWSCCWDSDDTNFFYAGAGNGSLHVFDIRNPSDSVVVLNEDEDSSAVVSVRYAPSKLSIGGGVICCRLNTVTYYEKRGPTEFTPVPLKTLVGPFFSLSYDPDTQHILVSCRPSEECSRVRHVYCELYGKECRKVHTFSGGNRQTLLSRSCFLRVHRETYVAVFQETTNSIDLWNTTTGSKIQSITVNDQILDFTFIKLENRYLLSTVSDSLVRFYEAATFKS